MGLQKSRRSNKLRRKLRKINGLTRTELQELYKDGDKSYQFFKNIIWKDGQKCPYCGCERFYDRVKKDRKEPTFRCANSKCKKDYTLKTGTILHHTKLSYWQWLEALYYCVNYKRGNAGIQLTEILGVDDKTAWYLIMRINEAFELEMSKPYGEHADVEVDEVYISPKLTNKHKHQRDAIKSERKKGNQGRSHIGKHVIIGMAERTTKQVKLILMPEDIQYTVKEKMTDEEYKKAKEEQTGRGRPRKTKETTYGTIPFKVCLNNILNTYIPHQNSRIFTDEATYYTDLSDRYSGHFAVVHGNTNKDDNNGEFHKIYEDPETGEIIDVTTNRVEGFFTGLKKTISGIHFHTSRYHLSKYLGAICFRYNTKDVGLKDRLALAVSCIGQKCYITYNRTKMTATERKRYMSGLSNLMG